VVGDRTGGHARIGGGLEHLAHPRGAVEHRLLGVRM
jgi:hypothetical protein